MYANSQRNTSDSSETSSIQNPEAKPGHAWHQYLPLAAERKGGDCNPTHKLVPIICKNAPTTPKQKKHRPLSRKNLIPVTHTKKVSSKPHTKSERFESSTTVGWFFSVIPWLGHLPPKGRLPKPLPMSMEPLEALSCGVLAVCWWFDTGLLPLNYRLITNAGATESLLYTQIQGLSHPQIRPERQAHLIKGQIVIWLHHGTWNRHGSRRWTNATVGCRWQLIHWSRCFM